MKFKLFSILLILAIFFGVIISSDHKQKPNFYKVDIQERAQIEKIYALMNEQKYDLALPLIEISLPKLLAKQSNDGSMIAWLYDMKAHVMASRYHFHYAIEAITKANQHKSDLRYRKLREEWLEEIDAMQGERQLRTSYISGRNAGLSQSLTNDIHIAYIYIDDNRSSKWSGKQRIKNQVSVDKVLDWYKQQASHYAIDELDFKVRYFVVNSPKGVGKEWLRDPAAFRQILNNLFKRLSFRGIGEFIEDIKGENKNSQVAIVFHSNYDGRSFAMSCPAGSRLYQCQYEYVMLTENINNTRLGWALPQVQAHEVLHLFGAKDLYNIAESKDYAVTDIMNYYSRDIKYATIDPISAWAIGWHKQPSTPFNIEK
ncbi:hypothetical protein [Shewanella woodyi]|nr:hypothetical protein [Shewanella woodyi]